MPPFCVRLRNVNKLLGFMTGLAGFAGTLARSLRPLLDHRPQSCPALFEISDYLQKLQIQLPLSSEAVSACSELSLRQKNLDVLREELETWRRETPKHPDWQVWSKLAFKEPRPLWTMVVGRLRVALG